MCVPVCRLIKIVRRGKKRKQQINNNSNGRCPEEEGDRRQKKKGLKHICSTAAAPAAAQEYILNLKPSVSEGESFWMRASVSWIELNASEGERQHSVHSAENSTTEAALAAKSLQLSAHKATAAAAAQTQFPKNGEEEETALLNGDSCEGDRQWNWLAGWSQH